MSFVGIRPTTKQTWVTLLPRDGLEEMQSCEAIGIITISMIVHGFGRRDVAVHPWSLAGKNIKQITIYNYQQKTGKVQRVR